MDNPTQPKVITLIPRNAKDTQFKFDIAGTANSTTLQIHNVSRASLKGSTLPNFSDATQAMNFIIGHFVSKNFSSAHSAVYESEDDLHYNGGLSTFDRCQRALGSETKWEEIYKNEALHTKMVTQMANASIYYDLKTACKDTDDNNSCIGGIIRTTSEANDLSKRAMNKAKDCDVIARVIKDNFTEGRNKDSDYINGADKPSFDGRLRCSVSSIVNLSLIHI